MHMNDLMNYRNDRDHEMRYGHLSPEDRRSMATHLMYPDKSSKDYHSPMADHEQIPQNNNGPGAP